MSVKSKPQIKTKLPLEVYLHPDFTKYKKSMVKKLCQHFSKHSGLTIKGYLCKLTIKGEHNIRRKIHKDFRTQSGYLQQHNLKMGLTLMWHFEMDYIEII